MPRSRKRPSRQPWTRIPSMPTASRRVAARYLSGPRNSSSYVPIRTKRTSGLVLCGRCRTTTSTAPSDRWKSTSSFRLKPGDEAFGAVEAQIVIFNEPGPQALAEPHGRRSHRRSCHGGLLMLREWLFDSRGRRCAVEELHCAIGFGVVEECLTQPFRAS